MGIRISQICPYHRMAMRGRATACIDSTIEITRILAHEDEALDSRSKVILVDDLALYA
jgi:hypothetical protein